MGKEIASVTSGIEDAVKEVEGAANYVGDAMKNPDEYRAGLAKHESEYKPSGNQTVELGRRYNNDH